MNMKRITDVPVIEELGENSYVLVNNNGEAAQISGSKVGGGGGSYLNLLWAIPDEEFFNVSVCRENDISTILDFETGAEKLLSERAFRTYKEGDEMVVAAGNFVIDRQRKMLIDYSTGGTQYVFSDTEIPEV